MGKEPKYHKGQVVYIGLLDRQGQPKNDLARRYSTYFAKSGVLVRCQRYRNREQLVYTVRMDGNELILVTEDCLVPVKEFHGSTKAHRHGSQG